LFAYLRQVNGNYTQALYLVAGLMTAALILPLLVAPPRGHKAEQPQTADRIAAQAVPEKF
jgi:hypothetical protein